MFKGVPFKVLPSELLAKGWLQHAAVDSVESPKRFCLLGAIIQSFGVSSSLYKKFKVVASQHLGLDQFLGCASLIVWNDHPKRTKQEVVDLAREVESQMGLGEHE